MLGHGLRDFSAVGGLGDDLDVLGPRELRARVRQRLPSAGRPYDAR
jgi:hypothetical protein